jgi:hypothetical protein
MAISRSQQLKELLPGLNALFGLEYKKYEEEHREIFETENSERSFEEETKLSGFGSAPVKSEGAAIAYDNAQEAWTARTTTKPLLLVLRSPKKLLRTTSMTLSRLATPKLWPVRWQTPNRLRLLTS